MLRRGRAQPRLGEEADRRCGASAPGEVCLVSRPRLPAAVRPPSAWHSAWPRDRGSPWSPSSASLSVGITVRRDHECRVRHDPAGVSRHAAGRSRRGSPTGRGRRPAQRRPRTLCSPEVRRHASTPLRNLEAAQVVELLPRPTRPCRPPRIARPSEQVEQLDEHLDVEGGVVQPGRGQRPGRPVDRRVLLRQPEAEQRLDQGRRARPGGSRAGGRPARCRTACVGVSPTSARQGRSWVAACRIHSASLERLLQRR